MFSISSLTNFFKSLIVGTTAAASSLAPTPDTDKAFNRDEQALIARALAGVVSQNIEYNLKPSLCSEFSKLAFNAAKEFQQTLGHIPFERSLVTSNFKKSIGEIQDLETIVGTDPRRYFMANREEIYKHALRNMQLYPLSQDDLAALYTLVTFQKPQAPSQLLALSKLAMSQQHAFMSQNTNLKETFKAFASPEPDISIFFEPNNLAIYVANAFRAISSAPEAGTSQRDLDLTTVSEQLTKVNTAVMNSKDHEVACHVLINRLGKDPNFADVA